MIIVRNPKTNLFVFEDDKDFTSTFSINYSEDVITFSLESDTYKLFSVTKESKEIYRLFSQLFFEVINGQLYKPVIEEDDYDFINFLNLFKEEYNYIVYNKNNALMVVDHKNVMIIIYSNEEFMIIFDGNENKIDVKMETKDGFYGDFYMPFLRFIESLSNSKTLKLVKQ